MLGHLYIYPHPFVSGQWLYVGQGAKRDLDHRHAHSGFGRRFRKTFPGVELPRPVRWIVEVMNRFDLNDEETIAMFRYKTWRGYAGGMNITLPGSTDYINMGRIAVQRGEMDRIRNLPQTKAAQHEVGRVNGAIQGRKMVQSGQLAYIRTLPQSKTGCRLGGHTQGRKNTESGHLATVQRIGRHIRWHINRGIFSSACVLCLTLKNE